MMKSIANHRWTLPFAAALAFACAEKSKMDEKPSAKPADKPADAPAAKPAEPAAEKPAETPLPGKIVITTSMGVIKAELYADKAPATVRNFVDYINNKHFDGTIFHRVIDGFMIQGGGFDEKFNQKPAPNKVRNEADNGLKNELYTLAMARTSDPHSASAQFFINVKNNEFLNHTSKTPQGWGYTVFGKVTEGQDVVDKIAKTPTGGGGPFPTDVPKTMVTITSIRTE